MRKWALVLMLILAVGAAGVALAQPSGPPTGGDSDPTCERGESSRSGHDCAGDNGEAGCQGLEVAEDYVPEGPGQDALDFVQNILDEGDFNDCEDD